MFAHFCWLGVVCGGYPLLFPTTTEGQPITPEGLTYWAGHGGTYFLGSASLATVGSLPTAGQYVPNLLVDSNVSDVGYTLFGLCVMTVSTGQDILLAARANLLFPTGPISAVTVCE